MMKNRGGCRSPASSRSPRRPRSSSRRNHGGGRPQRLRQGQYRDGDQLGSRRAEREVSPRFEHQRRHLNGSEARKPRAWPEVSLHLAGRLNGGGGEKKQISITRRLFRDGESDYLLTAKSRLRDIQASPGGTRRGADLRDDRAGTYRSDLEREAEGPAPHHRGGGRDRGGSNTAGVSRS